MTDWLIVALLLGIGMTIYAWLSELKIASDEFDQPGWRVALVGWAPFVVLGIIWLLG